MAPREERAPGRWMPSRRSVAAALATLAVVMSPGLTEGRSKKRRCRGGRRRCVGRCRDLQTDPRHCGACGRACGDGEACRDGACCREGTASCGGTCRGACSPPPANRPFPQRLGYGAVRPNRWNQDELDGHVCTAYDRWKANYIVGVGSSGDGFRRYRVAFGKPGSGNRDVTVSEGQGYGMVIVAHMAGYDPEAQTVFDGLWRFARDHPSEIDGRLMDWRVPGGNGNTSAFDGDCDMAYGLLLADAQWGSGSGIDYRSAFDTLIGGVFASTIGPRSRLPLLGDWVVPTGQKYNQDTPRPSDFMPGHFRAFQRATGGSWDAVVAACGKAIDQLQASFSPDTGLLPDFVEPVSGTDRSPRPASPNFLEGPYDGAYRYNAGRAPWRLGVDALLNADQGSGRQARKMSQWAEGTTRGEVTKLRAGYTLDGTPLPGADYFTTFFAAPLGVAAMTDPEAQDWVNDVYDAVHERSEDYYEDSVTLLCLLAMTGNFWSPG